MRTEKNARRAFIQQFYRGNRGNLALAMAGAVVTAVVNLVISWLLQQLVDLTTGVDTGFTLTQLTLVCVLSLALVALASGMEWIAMPRFLARAMTQYKNHAFQLLSQKSISAFSQENTALYISALSNDANTIEKDYLAQIINLITNVLLFFGALGLMLFYSPLLTLVSIGLALLPVLASILTGGRVAKAEALVSRRNETFMSTLKDVLTGFSVVKSFRAEAAMCGLFSKRVKTVEEAKRAKRRLSIVIDMFSSLAGIIAQMGVFIVGAYLALSGQGISAGVLIVFVQLMNFVISPIGQVPQLLAARKAAYALIDKLAKALTANVRDDGAPIDQELKDCIELKDVSFSYDGEKEVLRHVSARFDAGKSYALVGASGSGKSTLFSLLMAGQSQYTGEITYDGRELKGISSDSLYELVSIVQQNVFVFNNSIRENITMFREFPGAEVDEAIRLSGLSGLIAERGEDFLCGENGSGLSGGEKQRISIARSLLRKTPVLLVDEATAALDAQTAYQIANSILNLTGLTRIVITHALDENLLRRYDGILTLKEGRVVEAGRFDELMARKGYFYSLYTVSQ